MASSIALDALHVVLSFLDLRATAASSAVCRFWSSATTSEPLKSSGEGCVLPARNRLTADELEVILASRLSRHITSITAPAPLSSWGKPWAVRQPSTTDMWVQCSARALALLARLPRLAHLCVVLKEDGDIELPASTEFTLPRTLVSARLMCEYSNSLSGLVRALVDAADQLTTVELAWSDFSADLSPLQQLTHLTSLELEFSPWPYREVIRSLSSLRRLKVYNDNMHDHSYGYGDIDILRDFCAPGHSLNQLEFYDIEKGFFNLECVAVLSSLPSLTSFQKEDDDDNYYLDVQEPAALAQLHRLPCLRYLALDLGDRDLPADWSSVPHANLRVLKLTGLSDEQTHLAGFFASLPHLHTLELLGMPMESLEPLSALPRLETLKLALTSMRCHNHPTNRRCYSLPQWGCVVRDDFEEYLVVLTALLSLTSLHLFSLGQTVVRRSAMDQLRVPSESMPRLQHFYYSSELTRKICLWNLFPKGTDWPSDQTLESPPPWA